jgi:hypothetical protein
LNPLYCRRKKGEGRREKEEGRRKKEEGRRKKEEGKRKKDITHLWVCPSCDILPQGKLRIKNGCQSFIFSSHFG